MKVQRTEVVETGEFQVGDIIDFKINYGLGNAQALAVKEEKDGMVFILRDCFEKESLTLGDGTMFAGYIVKMMQILHCNLFKLFPDDLKQHMVEFSEESCKAAYTVDYFYESMPFYTEHGFEIDRRRLFRLPTEREILGCSDLTAGVDGSEYSESEQFEPMQIFRNRVAYRGFDSSKRNFSLCNYLLANQSRTSKSVPINGGLASLPLVIDEEGKLNTAYSPGHFSVNEYYIRPLFKLRID